MKGWKRMWRMSVKNKKIWDWIREDERECEECQWKTRKYETEYLNYQIFYEIKKFYFIFCVYKMYLITAEEYKNAGVLFLTVRKIGEIWSSMKDVIKV